MPSSGGDGKVFLEVGTEDLKIMSDYSSLSFSELMDLDCLTYKLLFKDAYIYKLKQTKEGQEYLEECHILTQTSPDKKALNSKFGERG